MDSSGIAHEARVIAFAPKRRAARTEGRRRSYARAILCLVIGIGVLGFVLLLGEGASLVTHHGLAGLGVGLFVVSALAWPLAGRWAGLSTRLDDEEPRRKQPISSAKSPRPLKPTRGSAEASTETP